jgi:hypothetical protein
MESEIFFPRERNGYIDDGSQLPDTSNICPNCKRKNYKQTVSTESCTSCNLFYDYWTNSQSSVYTEMMHREELMLNLADAMFFMN